MLNSLLVLLVIIPFILGFVTYGIQRFLKATSTETPKPTVTVRVTPETIQELKEYGYLDPNTGRLKDSAVGRVTWETTKVAKN